MSYHQIFIFVNIHDAHEWDRNLRLLFNTKWRSLDNFCRENFLRQSKHLTRLLFIFWHLYQIWVTDYFEPCSYVYTCLSTFTTNLYLLIYFKRSEFSGSSLWSPQPCFHCHTFLSISNFLLSNHHLHILCSFKEAEPFTSSISEFCPINYHHKFLTFSDLFRVNKHEVSVMYQEPWWGLSLSQHISYFSSTKWNWTLTNCVYFIIKRF